MSTRDSDQKPQPDGAAGRTAAAVAGRGGAWTLGDESALVVALRHGDERAMTLLYERYTPILLGEAARLRIPSDVRREEVADALRAVVLALVRQGSTAPRSLTGYAIVALRNMHRRRHRTEHRVAVLERALGHDLLARGLTAAFQEPVGEAEIGGDLPRYSRVLRALADAVDARLSPDERQLLIWLAEYVPQREIGRWLGLSHGAVRVRVHRLRERLRDEARVFGRTLPLAEQRELQRFFRRAGTTPPSTPTRRAPRGRSATDAETS